jgi:hypothetical protein
MRNRFAVIAILVMGCGHGTSAPGGHDAIIEGGTTQRGCPNGHADKIKFPQAESCVNDGSVEFCIPGSEPQLRDTLAAISPSITCGQGGGRAGCTRTPGLLLCSYPTTYPDQCLHVHGEMTAKTWSNMCAIAGLPQVVEIVPTFYE